jgi:hypothetical protein
MLMWPEDAAAELGVNVATVREMAEVLEGAVWSPLNDGQFWVESECLDHWRRHLRPSEPQQRTVVRTHPGWPETTEWSHA